MHSTQTIPRERERERERERKRERERERGCLRYKDRIEKKSKSER